MAKFKGVKLSNEYAKAFGALYAKTPKAVFAAIAFSLASEGGDFPNEGLIRFHDEWHTLHVNGIVPQLPPKERR
jgi:hypothetical protein